MRKEKEKEKQIHNCMNVRNAYWKGFQTVDEVSSVVKEFLLLKSRSGWRPL